MTKVFGKEHSKMCLQVFIKEVPFNPDHLFEQLQYWQLFARTQQAGLQSSFVEKLICTVSQSLQNTC